VEDKLARYRRDRISNKFSAYWGLDSKALTILRVNTPALGRPEPGSEDPRDLNGFSYASLGKEGEQITFELQDKLIDEIRDLLREQKVYTLATPLTIFSLKRGNGMADWDLGVPVAKGAKVQAPLVLKEFQGGKVFSKTFVQKEIIDPTTQDSGTDEVGSEKAIIPDSDPRKVLMDQAMEAGLQPEAVVIRWLDFDKWNLAHPEFRMEVMVVGNPVDLPEG